MIKERNFLTMKKIIALTLALCMVTIILTSCATMLSGEYSGKASLFGLAGAEVTYKFFGNKVTVTTKASVLGFEKETVYKGTYKIATDDAGKQTITFTYEGEGSSYSGSQSFSQDKSAKTITIGGVTYNKK